MLIITGTSSVCSGTQFSVVNIPTGATVTWTATPSSLFSTSSGSFTSLSGGYTLSLSSASNVSGTGTLTLTVNTVCGSPLQVQKTVWVGPPIIDGTYNGQLMSYSDNTLIYNQLCVSIEAITDMQISGSSSGSWQRISANPINLNWSTTADGQNIDFYFYAVNQTSEFRFSSANSCGTTIKNYYFKAISCSGGGGGGCDQYTVSPNPTSTTINVVVPDIPPPCNTASSLSITSQTTDEVQNDLTVQSIALIDANGQENHSQSFPIKTKEVNLDVSKFKKGIYILRISDGGYTEDHRIIIE